MSAGFPIRHSSSAVFEGNSNYIMSAGSISSTSPLSLRQRPSSHKAHSVYRKPYVSNVQSFETNLFQPPNLKTASHLNPDLIGLKQPLGPELALDDVQAIIGQPMVAQPVNSFLGHVKEEIKFPIRESASPLHGLSASVGNEQEAAQQGIDNLNQNVNDSGADNQATDSMHDYGLNLDTYLAGMNLESAVLHKRVHKLHLDHKNIITALGIGTFDLSKLSFTKDKMPGKLPFCADIEELALDPDFLRALADSKTCIILRIGKVTKPAELLALAAILEVNTSLQILEIMSFPLLMRPELNDIESAAKRWETYKVFKENFQILIEKITLNNHSLLYFVLPILTTLVPPEDPAIVQDIAKKYTDKKDREKVQSGRLFDLLSIFERLRSVLYRNQHLVTLSFKKAFEGDFKLATSSDTDMTDSDFGAFNYCKIMLLGNYESGKSLLMEGLFQDNDFSQNHKGSDIGEIDISDMPALLAPSPRANVARNKAVAIRNAPMITRSDALNLPKTGDSSDPSDTFPSPRKIRNGPTHSLGMTTREAVCYLQKADITGDTVEDLNFDNAAFDVETPDAQAYQYTRDFSYRKTHLLMKKITEYYFNTRKEEDKTLDLSFMGIHRRSVPIQTPSEIQTTNNVTVYKPNPVGAKRDSRREEALFPHQIRAQERKMGKYLKQYELEVPEEEDATEGPLAASKNQLSVGLGRKPASSRFISTLWNGFQRAATVQKNLNFPAKKNTNVKEIKTINVNTKDSTKQATMGATVHRFKPNLSSRSQKEKVFKKGSQQQRPKSGSSNSELSIDPDWLDRNVDFSNSGDEFGTLDFPSTIAPSLSVGNLNADASDTIPVVNNFSEPKSPMIPNGSVLNNELTGIQQAAKFFEIASRYEVLPLDLPSSLFDWEEYFKRLKSERLNFGITDFHGDISMKTLHPLFLSNSGGIIISFKLSTFVLENVTTWLHSTASKAPNSKIFLVGTHLDKLKSIILAEHNDNQDAGIALTVRLEKISMEIKEAISSLPVRNNIVFCKQLLFFPVVNSKTNTLRMGFSELRSAIAKECFAGVIESRSVKTISRFQRQLRTKEKDIVIRKGMQACEDYIPGSWVRAIDALFKKVLHICKNGHEMVRYRPFMLGDTERFRWVKEVKTCKVCKKNIPNQEHVAWFYCRLCEINYCQDCSSAQVKEMLQRHKTRPFMTLLQAQQFAATNFGISAEECESLLNFFRKQGLFFLDDSTKLTRDAVVLNPNFVAQNFCRILIDNTPAGTESFRYQSLTLAKVNLEGDYKNFYQTGIVSSDVLKSLWGRYYGYFRDVLRHERVIFDWTFKEESHFLVPSMLHKLTSTELNKLMNKKERLLEGYFEFDTSTMSPGLFYLVLASCVRSLDIPRDPKVTQNFARLIISEGGSPLYLRMSDTPPNRLYFQAYATNKQLPSILKMLQSIMRKVNHEEEQNALVWKIFLQDVTRNTEAKVYITLDEAKSRSLGPWFDDEDEVANNLMDPDTGLDVDVDALMG